MDVVVPPTRAEVEAALATGFAIHYRDGLLRFDTGGEHDIELDALGLWLRDLVTTHGTGRPAPPSSESAPASPPPDTISGHLIFREGA